ncbi:MAG: exodeoxyribonuclease VII small subunit [Nitrospinota bacterium]
MSEPSFEEALARLEAIVQELEEGEAELDRTLSLFEEGVKLSKLCHKRLEAAEKKIEILVKKEGGKLERREIEEPEDELKFPEDPQ